MNVWIESVAEGEDVVIRVGANDADRIVWALRQHARRTICAPEYRQMADSIEAAADQAFDNGAIPLPGLTMKVTMK